MDHGDLDTILKAAPAERLMAMIEFYCHACEHAFETSVENDFRTYEFRRCPRCESAKTTLR